MIWPFNKIFKRNMSIADAWLFKMGQPVYTKWTVQKAVEEGYKVNAWVFRSVYLIAKAISQVHWVVGDKDGAPLENHYLSKTFKNPHPNISRQDVFELIAAWLELAGNSYLKKVKAGGKTLELWPVSPDRLAPVPAKNIDEWVLGYALDRKRGVKFKPEEIIHHKFFNPANPLLGIAPLEAAARAVDVDNEQQDWNKAAMQNRGVIDGVMSFKRDFDDQDQVDKISKRINESTAGAANARKIKIVGSEAKYQRMGLNPAEMDFGNSRKFNREEIFITFGVPPVYAGVTEAATLNNYKTSELIFWFQTVIPLLDDLKDTFNNSLSDELSENEKIVYDLSKVRAIREAMLEWTETASKLHTMGVPFSQLNNSFEFGFDEFDGWDESYVKMNNASITVDERSRLNVMEMQKHIDDTLKNYKNTRNALLGEKFTLIERRDTNAEQEKIDKKAEGPVKDIFYNMLQQQQTAIFKNLSEKNVLKVIADSKGPWEAELEKLYLDIAGDFGSNMVVEQRKISNALNQALISFFESESTILTEVSNISETTTNLVLLHIANGVDQGLSTGDIQQAIIDSGAFSPERSLMLSRTLTGSAANLGQLTSAQLSGATHKTWSTSGFEVRDSHKKVDGEKVKIDETFIVGGEKARYPLDNNLSPAEKCNCRCTLTYSIED